MENCDKSGLRLTKQDDLDSYLLNALGQKISICGFVSFINSHHAAKLAVRVDEQKTRSMRRRQLEAEIIKILRDDQRGEAFENEWISISLTYFYGLPRGVGKKSKRISWATDADGNFSVLWNGETYFVPQWDFSVQREWPKCIFTAYIGLDLAGQLVDHFRTCSLCSL